MSQKLITVSIVGKPNAGKSTLLNKLIKQKLSIVTSKVQTTRTIITGVITCDDTQMIILDTPGIFEPKKTLERAMVRCAWSSIAGADLAAVLIDSTRNIDEKTLEIIRRLNALNSNILIILNKIDLKASKYLATLEELNKEFPDLNKICISASTGTNIVKLENYFKDQAKLSNWHYKDDDLTNLPMRFIAAEFTREQLFMNLEQELPYNLTVESEIYKELPDGSLKLHQVIIVSRESHKSIILGKKGEMIKRVGTCARQNISEFLDQKVHLFLFVKVRKNWDENAQNYEQMLLDFKK